MRQIKDCLVTLNNCSGSTVTQLLEYSVVNDNLYLVSEANESSLVNELPRLLAENKNNELVSVVVVHDLLRILKNIY